MSARSQRFGFERTFVGESLTRREGELPVGSEAPVKLWSSPIAKRRRLRLPEPRASVQVWLPPLLSYRPERTGEKPTFSLSKMTKGNLFTLALRENGPRRERFGFERTFVGESLTRREANGLPRHPCTVYFFCVVIPPRTNWGEANDLASSGHL